MATPHVRHSGAVTVPADALGALVVQLQTFTFEANRFAQVFAGAHSLHTTDLTALAHVSRATATGELITAGELSRVLSLSTSATTAVVDRLQRAGHVERVHDPVDRRRVRVRMTPSAQELAAQFFTPLGERMRHVLAGCGEEDLRRFGEILGRLVEGARAAADAAEAGSRSGPGNGAGDGAAVAGAVGR